MSEWNPDPSSKGWNEQAQVVPLLSMAEREIAIEIRRQKKWGFYGTNHRNMFWLGVTRELQQINTPGRR